MYDEIMRTGRYPYNKLFNIVFPAEERDVVKQEKALLKRADQYENEWTQEYHIIYNSYILDHKESLRKEE